jgi:protein TonB
MRADTVLQSDLLDILFEHRNKEYGAYTLRKEYDHRLMIALTAMFSLVILFFAWFFFNNNKNKDNTQIILPAEDSIVLRVVEIPRDPLPPPPPPPAMKPQPPVATIKSTPPVIVPDDVLPDPPPTTDQLDKDDALISNTTTDGEKPDGTMPVSPATGDHGSGPGQPQPAMMSEPEDKVWKAVEKMPEFPGGTAALIRFLGKHLRVPEDKLEAGERMRVPVKFVVDKDGMLTDVQFAETADEEYKSEIRRVMKKMPKWIPGIQNGKPVAVYFSIPIIFEVTDQ